VDSKSELQQSIGVTEITDPSGATVSEHTLLKEEIFSQPTCNVGMSAGLTLNMGNYNSYKVQVSLHMPCLPLEVDEVFDFVKKWVDTKLTLIHDEIETANSGGNDA
jgi:hypothetical protein